MQRERGVWRGGTACVRERDESEREREAEAGEELC